MPEIKPVEFYMSTGRARRILEVIGVDFCEVRCVSGSVVFGFFTSEKLVDFPSEELVVLAIDVAVLAKRKSIRGSGDVCRSNHPEFKKYVGFLCFSLSDLINREKFNQFSDIETKEINTEISMSSP